MRTLTIAFLLLGLASCRFTFDRELGPGELRARLVIAGDDGQRAAEGARAKLAGTRIETSADAEGRVVMRNVPAGSWTLRFLLETDDGDFSLHVHDVVLETLRDGVIEGRDLGTLVLRRVGAIEGVVTRDGVPVADAIVSGDGLERVVTDADGRYRLDAVPPGAHELSVEAGAFVFSRQSVSVQPTTTAQADIALEGLEELASGLVTGLAIQLGNPDFAHIRVWLESPARDVPLGVTDTDGRYSSNSHVPAGWYVAYAQGTDGAFVARDVLVDAGEELPPLYLPMAGGMDFDADDVADEHDNCPHVDNADQVDVDEDALGDACDRAPWASAVAVVVERSHDTRKATLPVDFDITVIDTFGNTVGDWNSLLSVVTTDRSATGPSSIELEDGQATFTVSFGTPGTHDVTLSGAVSGASTGIEILAAPVCGDGDIDTEVGETCDDGNAITERCEYFAASCVVCTDTCIDAPGVVPYCTDGIHDDPEETCDDGNQDDVDLCTNTCLPSVCGDGFLQPGERCDDGNADDTDDCDSQCRPTRCEGVELFPSTEPTAVLVVTNLNDTGPGSLRQALLDASPGALVRIDVEGTVALATQLVVDKALTVAGPGSGKLTLDGGRLGRVMSIAPTGDVYLSGVTLSNGFVDCATGCVGLPGRGAGLYNAGRAVLYDVRVSSHEVADISNSGMIGGAVYNAAGARLVLSDSVVSNNVANYRTGDAAMHNAGQATLCRSMITDNVTINSGGSGGIGSTGDLVIVDSLVAGNNQGNATGGGVAVYAGTATVRGTSLLFNTGAYGGGGILRTGGTVIVDRCTVIGNSAWRAPGSGGGLRGDMTVSNTLVSGNTSQGFSNDDVSGPFTSLGHNVIGAADGATGWIATDITGLRATPLTVPMQPLDDRGGRLHAMLPLQGNPVLDAADPTNAPAEDVRGRARDVDGVDVGAAEAALPRTELSVARETAGSLVASVAVTPNGLGTTVELWTSSPAGTGWTLHSSQRAGNGLTPVELQWTVDGLDPASDAGVRVVASNADGVWQEEATASVP